jgi:hypothetical protein
MASEADSLSIPDYSAYEISSNLPTSFVAMTLPPIDRAETKRTSFFSTVSVSLNVRPRLATLRSRVF